MKKLIYAIGLLSFVSVTANAANYYNQVVLSSNVSQINLVDAHYDLVPTKTAVQPIPGCNPNGELGSNCEETIVLESQEVVRVNISYIDNTFASDGNLLSYTSVVFNVSDFTAEQIAQLKSVYPAWKYPTSNLTRKFAKNNFSLDTKEVKETIRIVDTRKSTICYPQGEIGLPDPNCVEHLVYKDSWRKVTLITVNKK